MSKQTGSDDFVHFFTNPSCITFYHSYFLCCTYQKGPLMLRPPQCLSYILLYCISPHFSHFTHLLLYVLYKRSKLLHTRKGDLFDSHSTLKIRFQLNFSLHPASYSFPTHHYFPQSMNIAIAIITDAIYFIALPQHVNST